MKTKHSGRYVAYYRVSTARQGRSGLGLEAQRQAVGEHLNGGNWKLVGEYTEVESGKRSDRPKLAEALKACRLQGAKLIIAKLDRLACNVAFISNLMESKVEFEAVDFPQANRLTIHIMAAIAEHEAKMISDRTRAALRRRRHAASGSAVSGVALARLPIAPKPDGPNRSQRNLAPPNWRQSSKTYELPVQIRCVQSRGN
jgi:DNA invertase Pin-like site-specific DNA recombinase